MTTVLDVELEDLVPAGLSPAEEEFAVEALAFLDANARRREPEVLAWGHGSENLSLFHETTGEAERVEVVAAQEWQRKKWDAGFGWVVGPVEFGGRALAPGFEALYRILEGRFVVPDWSPLRIGLSTVGPGILACGTPDQARLFSARIQQGTLVACQLFSEPEAGSDLAAVRCRGERDGDIWRLDGQKVWTSNAQVADIGFALVRTDPGAPKHKGLTAFVVPMAQDGVDVRPLRQLTGGASFTEVFLDGAIVPDTHRIGAAGEGWSVAVRTLAAERASTGDRSHVMTERALALLLELAKRTSVDTDPIHRQRLADVAIRLRVAQYHQRRMQAVPAADLRGPERAVDKLLLADNLRRIGDTAAAILGPKAVADTGQWGTYAWSSWLLGAVGYRLGGGSDEILRSVLGEQLLGLPREPK
jgi:alkylation response protein AidB-like acyl-CoA dehydrogenase